MEDGLRERLTRDIKTNLQIFGMLQQVSPLCQSYVMELIQLFFYTVSY